MTTTRAHSDHSLHSPPLHKPGATVDVHDTVAGLLSVLEIDAPRDDDVTFTVESALFDLRIQVVRVRSRTTRRRAVHEYEVVEFDGAPLRQSRQLEVRRAIKERLQAS